MSIKARGEITSKARRASPESGFLGLLRRAALVALLVGAAQLGSTLFALATDMAGYHGCFTLCRILVAARK